MSSTWDGDGDSAIGDADSSDAESSTRSLDTEAERGDYKYGRRYHSYKAGKYDLPNDDYEQQRLEIQHQVWMNSMNGRLQAAPIPEDIQDALDVATGTGRWAIDFADLHPSARVIGVDLSPIQPTWVPPNCMFEIDDAEMNWTYHHKFDFIHARMLTLGWRDWDKLSAQAFTFLRPGGWVEYDEFTYPVTCDCERGAHAKTPLVEGVEHVVEAVAKRGIQMHSPEDMAKRLEKAGFVNVCIDKYKWYMSDEDVKADALRGVEAVAFKLFVEQLKWSNEKVLVYLTTVRKYMQEQVEKHEYLPTWAVYGQKPETVDEKGH